MSSLSFPSVYFFRQAMMILPVFFILAPFLLPGLVQAQSETSDPNFVGPTRPADDLIGDLRGDIAQLNRLKTTDPAELIGRVIKIVLQVVGSIALLVFVYGGIMWMTARGNAERTGRAIKIIAWGALGVAVILASYTLVEFIFGVVK